MKMNGPPLPMRLAAMAVVVAAAMACHRDAPGHAVPASPAFAPRQGVPATDTTTTATAAGTTMIDVRQGGEGAYFVDEGGRALYTSSIDGVNDSRCGDACVQDWPPVPAPARAGSAAVDPQRIGVMTRSDGTHQVTYGGMPLYRFAGDHDPGDARGAGQREFGAVWRLARPSS